MISLILFYILVTAIVLSPLFQKTSDRFYAAFCYAAILLVHTVFSSYLSDVMYYVSAILSDYLVIILMLLARERLALSLIKICAISAPLNLIGLVVYEYGWNGEIYNVAFLVLYAFAVFALYRDKSDDKLFIFSFYRRCSDSLRARCIHLFKAQEVHK